MTGATYYYPTSVLLAAFVGGLAAGVGMAYSYREIVDRNEHSAPIVNFSDLNDDGITDLSVRTKNVEEIVLLGSEDGTYKSIEQKLE